MGLPGPTNPVPGMSPGRRAAYRLHSTPTLTLAQRADLGQLIEILERVYGELPLEVCSAYSVVVDRLTTEEPHGSV